MRFGELPFYGSLKADCRPVDAAYSMLEDPRYLFNALWQIWSADTCAPRMRDRWSPENRTLGHCSITAFLAQDVFGGEVRGIPLGDGNFHCYNAAGGRTFDLTSEQFAPCVLTYSESDPVQLRELHFAKEEKRLRYELLKARLNEFLKIGSGK